MKQLVPVKDLPFIPGPDLNDVESPFKISQGPGIQLLPG